MVTEFGDYESGQIRIDRTADLVSVTLHWPFDRELDEWIDSTAQFSPARIQTHGDGDVLLSVIDADSTLEIRSAPDGRYHLFLQGRNSLRKVEADLLIPAELGREVVGELVAAIP